jgi:hypothetical protein
VQNTFEEFIKEKTVSLVGPASYMMGSDHGEQIDSDDVVIRINRSYESVDVFSSDIGKRTDILYSCLIEKNANAGMLDRDVLVSKGIKYICAPPASDMKGQSNKTTLHSLIDVDKIRDISKEIPVRVVDHIFHNQLAREVNCRPNTGFMAIYDILRCSPKKLSLYGFSFYLDGFVKGVKAGIEVEQNKTPEEFTENCFNSKRHIQKNMWNYAKNTLLNNDSISLDPHLNLILSLDNLDKNEFYNKLIHMREANNA